MSAPRTGHRLSPPAGSPTVGDGDSDDFESFAAIRPRQNQIVCDIQTIPEYISLQTIIARFHSEVSHGAKRTRYPSWLAASRCFTARTREPNASGVVPNEQPKRPRKPKNPAKPKKSRERPPSVPVPASSAAVSVVNPDAAGEPSVAILDSSVNAGLASQKGQADRNRSGEIPRGPLRGNDHAINSAIDRPARCAPGGGHAGQTAELDPGP